MKLVKAAESGGYQVSHIEREPDGKVRIGLKHPKTNVTKAAEPSDHGDTKPLRLRGNNARPRSGNACECCDKLPSSRAYPRSKTTPNAVTNLSPCGGAFKQCFNFSRAFADPLGARRA
jgi:hypothetical protein